MASISRPNDTADGRSGGKVLRGRRNAAPRTPYDRPSHLLPHSAPQNPNWLSKLILSPTRMIATGAGKFLSVFRSESSSSSSSDDYSTSEGDSDDANDDIGVSSQDANELEKFDSMEKDTRTIEWKSETKRAIERLLLQETFSREECDRLTHIIKSRVVDPPLTGGIEARQDVDMPDLYSSAVTEAKKWLEERKLGSSSKPQLEYGTCTLNTAVSPHVMEGEIGSPVDLAKLYMRERPPWSSPSMKDSQLKSPSLTTTQLFKEDTPCLYSGNSVFASKLIRDTPSTGSWNITEEIRKVRSKATEDLLRTRPLLMIDISTLGSDNIWNPGSFVADKTESVSQIAQDRSLNQASPLDPVASVSQQSQGLVAIQVTEGVEALRERLQPSEDMTAETQNGTTAVADGPKDTAGDGQGLNSTVREVQTSSSSLLRFAYSKSHEINDSTLVEVTAADGRVAANGFPSPRSSLHEGQEGEEKSKLSSERNKLINSVHNNEDTSAPVDEIYKLLGEFNEDIPIINENDMEATISQNSSSMLYEEVREEEMVPRNLKRKAGKTNDTTAAEKQQAGRRRYARKGKGGVK